MAQNSVQSETYNTILHLDTHIRFVGRIKDRKLVSFARRPTSNALLDEELGNMAHYQASLKASWEDMFNERLGKTNYLITAKEKVKLITLFLDDGLLILSADPDSDHDGIIAKIKSLNTRL